jgi:heat shock protein HslJ
MRVQQRDGTFVVNSVTVTVTPTQEAQISFWADQTTINQGQCTRLHWSVENVQGVWVYPQGENFERYPRVGHDSEQVCPSSTTTYEMRVLLRDGSTVFRTVTINVNPAPTATPVANPLAGTRWDITSFNNGQGGVVTLLLDTHANVSFAGDGGMSGNASCNSFNGSYWVTGNSINISQLGSAQVFCAEPEGIMDQEGQILAALQSAVTFTISGNSMEMRNGSGGIALTLQRAP